MEKNDFLLYNEIIYHIHTCQDMDDLKRSILAQVKLMIPYTYASLIVVEIDPETREIRHSDPFCLPDSFTALEEAWIDRDHQDESFWVSHAPESIVVRSSDLTGEARLESPIFQELYQQYNIYDTMSMNLAYDHQVMALLTLYRTRADGVFTDQEAFYLRALAGHVLHHGPAGGQQAPQDPDHGGAGPRLRTDPPGDGDSGPGLPGPQQRRDSGPAPYLPAHPAQALAKPVPQVRGFLPLGPAEAAALKGERRCTRRDLPMETNDFLLYNEVLYRLHACRTMEELKPTLLGQLKLMIPYTYASFLSIQVDPETQELVHRDPFCQPRQFEAAERAWLGQIDQSYSIWLSHAPESMVVRDSEILSGDNRFSAPSYRKIYLDYHIYDCMQMNITYAGQAMGRLAFYRTQADGLFTDREAFLLRTLSNHIDLACYHCTQRQAQAAQPARTLEELTQVYGLTRRETEILGLVFQDRNNEEILEQLHISKNTLLKHLQNLYRKCGVSSRWDLLKLR